MARDSICNYKNYKILLYMLETLSRSGHHVLQRIDTLLYVIGCIRQSTCSSIQFCMIMRAAAAHFNYYLTKLFFKYHIYYLYLNYLHLR